MHRYDRSGGAARRLRFSSLGTLSKSRVDAHSSCPRLGSFFEGTHNENILRLSDVRPEFGICLYLGGDGAVPPPACVSAPLLLRWRLRWFELVLAPPPHLAVATALH